MMNTAYQQFRQQFPATESNKSLAALSTFHIGGMADLYYRITDIDEIPSLMASAASLKIPYFILGGGSNTLFSDQGFRGVVLHFQARDLSVEEDRVIADAGALLSQVLQFALKNSLSGLEKLMGLPGTIGGAVRGNAGAYGMEIQDIFEKAVLYNEEKRFFEADKAYFHFGYRDSTIKRSKDMIVRVFLKLEKKNTDQALQEAFTTLKSRSGKQPTGKTAGSFFKNPGSKFKAGHLLEQAGCKGLRVGQAQVSLQHANWIMNLGAATQKDILELAAKMQKKVQECFQITLEPEVQFVAENGFLETFF